MTDDFAGPDADEQALADLFRALEGAQGDGPDVDEAIRRHPALAGEIRQLLELRRRLERPRPEPAPPMPERLGEFRLVRRLETGGMGDVYEAWQESLQRRVAIKVLRHGQHSPQARERFLREQQVLARLHQTNIVPIHAAGRAEQVEYFAMPFIDGAALRYVVQAAAEHDSTRPGSRTPEIAELVGQARTGRQAAGGTVPREVRPFRPSRAYLRSVAKVMADAARAVQHAHDEGILHRDLKPSNIMVEAHANADGRRTDQCWVIDFGLSSYRSGAATAAPGSGHGDTDAVPAVSGVMGTPAYMAPEQFEQQADERTDVWGLGVTLYELLTLRCAFSGSAGGSEAVRLAAVRERILAQDPPRPRGSVPRDLEAICFKALRKDPRRRYASAGEFADDLRRWLAGEPVRARAEEAPLLATAIHFARWMLRNRGWSVAIGVALAAVLAGASQRFAATEARRRHAERARMVQELELLCARPHQAGWSDRALALAQRIGEGGNDDHTAEAYLATLAGLDARMVGECAGRASSLAFDGPGGGLLLGGAPAESGFPDQPPSSWSPGVARESASLSGLAAHGPVTRGSDGRRLQFLHAGGPEYLLWDMDHGATLASFVLPGAAGAVDEPMRNDLHQPVLAMAADASTVAAAATRAAPGDPDTMVGEVCAWEVATGRLLLLLPVRATALTLSGDGRLLAAGDGEGRVGVWSLPQGVQLAEIPDGSEPVRALAFGANPVAPGARHAPDLVGRLAIGSSSGRISVRDLGRGDLRATCLGIEHYVLSMAFNPEGTLLAAAGSEALLWDSTTGQLLLEVPVQCGNAVAFSADGRQVAVASYERFGSPGQVALFELQPERGLQTLRGLNALVHVVAFSADGLQVAALSNDWNIGIWDCATGALRRILAAPRGFSCDNAGLAFSGDGARIACVAGTEARLWDAATGALLRTWPLPAGLADGLTFDDRGDIIVVRCEPSEPASPPPERTHAVCRVRNLSSGEGGQMVFEDPEFDVKVVSLVLDPRGTWLAVEGDATGIAGVERRIKAVGIPSGVPLWPTITCDKQRDVASLQVDPTGGYLSFLVSDGGLRSLVAMPSGALQERSAAALSLAPGAETYVTDVESAGGVQVIGLFRRGGARPELLLRDAVSARTKIDATGTRIAWGRPDGTVMLGDLERIRRDRAALGPR